jgi:hypothetical protein
VERIVDRLRDARSRSWLRVIDDAELHRPADLDDRPDAVVAPYRWLLERVGTGVRLTQAGYLPPALVAEAMAALCWQNDWPGKHNREDLTIPILELRESAQRFGLLRKNRGQLLVTKVGRSLVDDPVGLWRHVAARLPDARSEPERDAGTLYLLTVAAGRSRDDALLAEGMSILGWAEGGSRRPLSPVSAFGAARDTWAVFRRLGLLGERDDWGKPQPPPPPQARMLARAALLGGPATAPTRAEPKSARRATEQAVQLSVTLRDIEPPIWRRLLVPASLTLDELHAVIQTAMGWEDYHLHLFEVDGTLISATRWKAARSGTRRRSPSGRRPRPWTNSLRVRLRRQLGPRHPRRAGHRQRRRLAPHLVGARACPPEDCGGPWGYQHLLEVLADPAHEEHEGLLGWVGGGFDPEA